MIIIADKNPCKVVLFQKENSEWHQLQEWVSGDKVSYTGPVAVDKSGNYISIGGIVNDEGKMIFIYKRNHKNPNSMNVGIQGEASHFLFEMSSNKEDILVYHKLLFRQERSQSLILQ